MQKKNTEDSVTEMSTDSIQNKLHKNGLIAMICTEKEREKHILDSYLDV